MDCPFCKLIKDKSNASFIIDFGKTYAVLNWDQRFPGRSILVIKDHHDDLSEIDQNHLSFVMKDLQVLAKAIKKTFNPDRMNYCSLGNVVSHTHFHLIPRYKSEPTWGGPPDFIEHPEKQTDEFYKSLAEKIRANIEGANP